MSKTLPTIKDMPAVPHLAVFSLQKIETVSMPHPYMITPKHVAWAADHFGGMLSTEAIRDAEKHGAHCEICVKRGKGTILSIDQHENNVTLFIQVPDNTADLNTIPKLHEYLFQNKAAFESLGIQSFAFPNK